MDYRGGGRPRYSQDGYGHFQGHSHNDGRFNQAQRSGSHNEYPTPSNSYSSGYAPNEFYPKANNPTIVPHSSMPVPTGSGFSASNISSSSTDQQDTAPDNYGGTYNSRQFSQRQGTSYNYQNFDNRPDLPDAQKSRYELSDSRKGDSSYRNMHFREEFNKKSDSLRESDIVRDYSHHRDRNKGEKDDRPSHKSTEDKSNSDSLSDINIYELLKDERLKNVLYAGISKATAKLEHSLKMNMGAENITFLETSKSSGTQLFPSASADHKPKSILKRKGAGDEDDNSNDSFSKSSALEKTLQLLQNKTSFDSGGTFSKSSKQGTDALSQLSTYIDAEDEKLSPNTVSSKQSKESESRQPFWSVSAVSSNSETSKRETDTFDLKEQLYEQWRQSIHRNDDAQRSSRKQKLSNVDPFFQKKIADKIESSSSQNLMDPAKKDGEDLDTTVQNILQSIGFNFDLSKRMQELARQKKQQQDDFQAGIVDQSASFLDKNIFDDDLKASFLRADIKEPNLESLIKEARASSQKSRNYEGGVISLERSRKDEKQSQDQFRRSSSHDNRQQEETSGNYEKWEYSGINQTDKRAGPGYKGDERNTSRKEIIPRSRSYSRDRDSISPSRGRYKAGRSDGEKYLEKLRDEPKDEYFYPDEGDYNKPPAVPLLSSFSNRRNEDLSSGLLTKLSSRNVHVENLQVTSCSIESSDEPFMESRRIILPAKQDKRIASRSPSYRDITPEAKRKRTASPLSPLPKERKVGDYRDRPRNDSYYDRLSVEKSPIHHPRTKSRSPDYGSSPRRRYSPELKSGSYYRSPGRELSPKYNVSRSHQTSRYEDKFSKREKSPLKYSNDGKNVRNFNYNKKPERKRSYSPDYPRSSMRRRSRSPIYRSPNRRRSRSIERYRRSPERFRSPLRDSRRSPYRKKSPLRLKSTEQRRPFEKEKYGKCPEKSDSSKTEKSEFSKLSEPSLTDKSLEPSGKVDVSKLAPEERKAYLQKMLEKKQSVDEIKQGLLAAVERLGDISVEDRKQLLLKMSQATPAERQKIMNDLSQRQLKVNTLKLELNKLKKEQNELLRKSWRNGTAGKEPELLKNEEQQASIQQEIQRLSTTDLDVPLNISSSPPPSHMSKKEKPVAGHKTLKGKDKAVTAPGKKNTTAQSAAGKEGSIQTSGSKTLKTVADSADDTVKIKQEKTSSKEEGDQKAHDGKELTNRQKTYFEYYDSGNYWCIHCNAAANNLQQLYSHFHGKKHKNCIEKVKKPWKEVKKESVATRRVGVAQSRRVKGAEMMFPITGFYCTLCEIFCGDFADSTDHLKSDSHYNKYMDYVEKNPMYEKSLLLSKTAAKDPNSSRDKNSASNKMKSKKKNLRVTGTEESDESENESVSVDIIDVVDMELDEDCIEQSQPKIPKLTAKQLPSITPMILSTAVDMKETKEDRDKPLDKFLSIASTGHQGKKSQLPVVTKDSMDLSSIPIPEGPCLPDPERLSAKSKVEALVVEQEDKALGADDVRTEESTISVHDIPMPENPEGKKVKSLDTLFARLSKTVPTKNKPKPTLTTGATNPDMEKKIQEEIQAKLNREKQKLIRKKQKEEEKEKKVEEEQTPRKRYISDSDSSSDESEVEMPEDNKSEVDRPSNEAGDNDVCKSIQSVIDSDTGAAQYTSKQTCPDIDSEMLDTIVAQDISKQTHPCVELNSRDQVTETVSDLDGIVQVTETVNDLESAKQVTESVDDLNSVDQVTKTVSDLDSIVQVTETVNDLESANQVTESVDDLNSVDQVTKTVSDLDSIVQVTETVNDLESANQVTESVDELYSGVQVTKTVDDLDSGAQVTKTVDDLDNMAQVTKTVDDLDNMAQVTKTVDDQGIITQITETVDDLDSKAQVTKTVDDLDSGAQVTKTVDDQGIRTQITETVDDLDNMAQVTETVDDLDNMTQVTETVDDLDSGAQVTETVDDLVDDLDNRAQDTETVDDDIVAQVTETVDDLNSVVQVIEADGDQDSVALGTDIIDDQDSVAQVTKTVNDLESMVQDTETVDDLDSVAQDTETVDDLDSVAQVTETVDDLDTVAQFTETDDELDSVAQVSETVGDLDSLVQVSETVGDLDSLVQITETFTDLNSVVQVIEADDDQDSVAQDTDIIDDLDSVAQVTKTVNDLESMAQDTETINDLHIVVHATDTVIALDSVTPVAGTVNNVHTKQQITNFVTDLVVEHQVSENVHGNIQEDSQQDEDQWTEQMSCEYSQDASDTISLMEPTNIFPPPPPLEDDDSNTLPFGEILSVETETSLLNANRVEDCEKMDSNIDDDGLFTKKITESEADVITWDLFPEEGQSQSGQGKDPPMSGVVSDVEPVDADIVAVANDEASDFETENSPTDGLVLGLEDDDDMDFNIVMSDKQENGTDLG